MKPFPLALNSQRHKLNPAEPFIHFLGIDVTLGHADTRVQVAQPLE